MSPDELEALGELAARATPGPWYGRYGELHYQGPHTYITQVDEKGRDGAFIAGAVISGSTADFIAACRTDIPDLIAHCRKLRESLEELDCLLDFGVPYGPAETGPRNPDKLNAVFAKASALLREP